MTSTKTARNSSEHFWKIVKLWWPKHGPQKHFWQLTPGITGADLTNKTLEEE